MTRPTSRTTATARVSDATLRQVRDRCLDVAIAAGKFAREQREHYAAMWDDDPTTALKLLASLASAPAAPVAATRVAAPDGRPASVLHAEAAAALPPGSYPALGLGPVPGGVRSCGD